MKTYKTKRTVCRASRKGRFAKKGMCKAFKRTLVKAVSNGFLFK